MSLEFQIEATTGSARASRLLTPHGEIKTPVFMPVGTVGTVKGISQDILEDIGTQILLGNTYHLYLRPGVETVRKLGGLHGFMSWPRAILTDSGGFQVFSLNELRKVTEAGVTFRSHLDGSSHFFSPESAMAAQIGLGADIIMAFDECTEHPADQARTKASMEMTLRWAARSKNYFEAHKHEVPWSKESEAITANVGTAAPGCPAEQSSAGFPRQEHGTLITGEPLAASIPQRPSTPALVAPHAETSGAALRGQPGAAVPTLPGQTQSLFGIVQGGMDRALRKESAERTIEIGFPGYAIGGLSVGEPRNLTREIVESTLEYLPKDKPRYLMGVGTPEEIVEYSNLGVDMMDCVLPTRAARHGLLFTSEGRVSIKQARYAQDQGPLDPNCPCRVCQRYSRAYLRHLYASNEVLAQVLNTIHNLSFYLDTMRRVRHSISLGEESRFLSGVWSRPKS
jgi:queuine tRNA-ribosyltransferase